MRRCRNPCAAIGPGHRTHTHAARCHYVSPPRPTRASWTLQPPDLTLDPFLLPMDRYLPPRGQKLGALLRLVLRPDPAGPVAPKPGRPKRSYQTVSRCPSLLFACFSSCVSPRASLMIWLPPYICGAV